MNRFHRVLNLTLLALIAAPNIVLAHPGHGRTEPQTIWHYLSEPLHGGGLWVALIIVAVVGFACRRRFSRRQGNIKSR